METLKKFAVGIIGVLILWGMGYVLIQASHEPAGSLSPRQPAPAERVEPVPPESGEQPAPPVSRRGPSSPPETPLPSTAPSDGTPQPPGDTIAWRRAPSPKAPAGNGDAPVLSGKMPAYGNPNPIFIRAANRILPAVVTVHSTRRVRHPSINFFSPFFWKKDKDQEGEGEEDEQDFFQPGTGSGIIISKDGYIMTNHHVIENAQDVRVTLYDKREYTARIIGSDPTTDVGLLKIDIGEDTIPVAYIGNSDSIRIGEWVIAVGNPLNFNSTVTTGIISALGRSIDIIDRRYRYRIENFIQTDAVINPGNSGGALVNLNGEVIGINTAIATRNGFYQGYGFAIPINLARKVVSDLIKYGRVRRALLGVSIENVSDRVARAVGLPRPTGALVQGVSPGFPAEEVGLRQGDIILSVNGEEVVSVSDLQTKIARHQPGDVVTLVIWRDRRKWEVDVQLAEAPLEGQPQAGTEEKKPEFKNLGITVRGIPEAELKNLKLDHGLLIEEVMPGSPAERAGVIPSTVLVSINSVPVGSVAQFERIIEEAKSGDILTLKILELSTEADRDGRIVFVEVP